MQITVQHFKKENKFDLKKVFVTLPLSTALDLGCRRRCRIKTGKSLRIGTEKKRRQERSIREMNLNTNLLLEKFIYCY